jgi:hypothetical protein
MASRVTALLEDFIGLYSRDTLARWRTLFLPGFVATAPNEDGSLTTWNLDEFYERQRTLFATGKPISEVLQNTEMRCDGDLAVVRSDFVWTDGEARRPGRLMMLIVAEHGELRIRAGPAQPPPTSASNLFADTLA